MSGGNSNGFGILSSEDVVRQAYEFNGAFGGGAPPRRAPTGFGLVDECIGGITAGELVILGARPNVGKSTALLFSARSMELAGFRPGIISLEDTPITVGERIQAFSSRVSAVSLRSGAGGVDEEKVLRDVKRWTTNYAFPIGGEADEVVMLMDQLVKKGADVLLIDYLTAIEVRGDLRTGYSSLLNRLKGTALRLGVPLVLACQLKRPQWGREGFKKEPDLHELAETSYIERKAEIVLLFWRDSGATLGKVAKLKYTQDLLDTKFRVTIDENTGLLTTEIMVESTKQEDR